MPTTRDTAARIAADMAGDDQQAREEAYATYEAETERAEETDEWDLVAAIEAAMDERGLRDDPQ